MQPHIIWEEFLKIVKEESGSQVVETWFKAVTLQEVDLYTNSITLAMPNSFICNWIREHYNELLQTHLKRLLNTPALHITFLPHHGKTSTSHKGEYALAYPLPPKEQPLFRSPHPSVTPTEVPPASSASLPTRNNTPVLHHTAHYKPACTPNEHYTFNSFVVGPSNSLAHGAAYAVSQSLASCYNPLFIYGGTGLGKTHLLHAVGNEAKQKNPGIKVRYETADHFMNEFIKSIRFDKGHEFRERYNSVDLLLIDDIQFFANKEQTQEIFFHIFNSLYNQKKQIVLTCDVMPEEVKGLQHRLVSRMEWGLIADLQTPDLETRIAILNRKAEQQNITITPEVAAFIASRVNANIRQLEGALIRVDAFSSLTGQPIDISLARRVLLNSGVGSGNNARNAVEMNLVTHAIAEHYNLTVAEIKSKKRDKDTTLARQVTCYLIKKLTPYSLQSIGTYLGGRDHSTVIHALTKIEERIGKDPVFEKKIKMLESAITSQ